MPTLLTTISKHFISISLLSLCPLLLLTTAIDTVRRPSLQAVVGSAAPY